MKKMKKMKNSVLLVAFAAFFIIAATACEDNRYKAGKDKSVETMTSGKITAYCDDALYDLLDTAFKMYQKTYPDVELEVISANARETMGQLLSGKSRVIFIGRDYLPDEDSLMKVFNVSNHTFEEIANDALCFFTERDNPLDTLNADQIYNILVKNKNFKDYFPKLATEPILAICDQNSSVYSNMQKLAARGESIARNMRLFSTADSVRQFVKNTPNSIGILYLHNVIRNLDFKTIPIGYHDSTGKYITPKPVHQAYIIQGLYPYTVTFKAMFLEEFKNLPFWLGAYVARESVVTKYLKDAGVVPSFARFKLIKED